MALEIEIDGKKLTVPDGSTIMDAAHQVGTYIPHFCYHKKLSIAANCRMCLVEVEKAPKPLPACATPVTDGMKVFTHSDLAVKAQKGVMEFLLINHPLDCPICDQGGECQLQDLAVGYGGGDSRYQEEKRSVPEKNMGPLVSAEEMARCIHCTRCVRFTEEIGGFQEIGMAHRGEFSEILPFLGKTVDSEISGNVIDLCPVGALTSKPFRYSARTWELSRRKSVSPHDGLGSNMVLQVKHNRVYRALPLENENINECWLADRDRFSYEALNSDLRLTKPMVKQDGRWIETDWAAALDYVSHGLKDIITRDGADRVAFLASPHSTTEELFALKKLARALGVKNTDYRTRRADFRADGLQHGALWLGCDIVELAAAKSVLVIGSTLRKEQPLLAARLRQSVKKGTQLNLVALADDDLRTDTHAKLVVAPAALVNTLAQVVAAAAELKQESCQLSLDGVSIGDEARRMATSLSEAETGAIVLGHLAQHHPAFSELLLLVQELSRLTGARFGVFGEAANSVGAELFFRPDQGGLNAAQMLAQPQAAYVLLNTEPDFDAHNPQVAKATLGQAKMVAALTAFRSPELLACADVLLPIAPFTETAGSFVNMEGRLQTFNGVVKPLGETRPAWKVLRVLGNLAQASGFDFSSVEEIRTEFAKQLNADRVTGLDNTLKTDAATVNTAVVTDGLQRLGEVPIYQADALCRRAVSLQQTADARAPILGLHPETLREQQLQAGQTVTVRQGEAEVSLTVGEDVTLPVGVARVPTAHPLTASLGAMFGRIDIVRGK